MSDPIEILERRLERVVSGKQGPLGLHFFCQIGGHYDDLGMTTLQVSGSGWVLVCWRDSNEEEDALYSVQLAQDDLDRFYALLNTHRFWSVSPTRRPRRDGETNIHIRLSDQEKRTYNGLQFWDTQMQEFPTLHHLMSSLINLIRRVSDDEIPSLQVDATAA